MSRNCSFGQAAVAVVDGNSLGIENVTTIFSLPFITPPNDPSFATEHVVPMIPALLVLVPPLLAAIGLRLILYIGLHSIIKVITTYIHDTIDGNQDILTILQQ